MMGTPFVEKDYSIQNTEGDGAIMQ